MCVSTFVCVCVCVSLAQASAPGEPPFCKAGDKVKKGQVVGIVEAMKLMNEIEVNAHTHTQRERERDTHRLSRAGGHAHTHTQMRARTHTHAHTCLPAFLPLYHCFALSDL